MVNVLTWQDGKTPLMYAAERGHESIFQSLVSLGSDINAKDRVRSMIVWERALLLWLNFVVLQYGSTPLAFAVKGGCKGIVQMLVSLGCDVNSVSICSIYFFVCGICVECNDDHRRSCCHQW